MIIEEEIGCNTNLMEIIIFTFCHDKVKSQIVLSCLDILFCCLVSIKGASFSCLVSQSEMRIITNTCSHMRYGKKFYLVKSSLP